MNRFIISLRNPIKKVTLYTNLLKRSIVNNNNNNKLLLYSALVHPQEYNKYNINKDNNNFYNFIQDYNNPNTPIFDSKHNTLLKTFLQRQLPFIEQLPKEDITLDDNDVENYHKFMYLVKKYPNKVLIPSKKIDYIWHAHMLDHDVYVKDTKDYFGYILGHNDNVPRNLGYDCMYQIEDIWKKEFNTLYPPVQNFIEHLERQKDDNDRIKEENRIKEEDRIKEENRIKEERLDMMTIWVPLTVSYILYDRRRENDNITQANKSRKVNNYYSTCAVLDEASTINTSRNIKKNSSILNNDNSTHTNITEKSYDENKDTTHNLNHTPSKNNDIIYEPYVSSCSSEYSSSTSSSSDSSTNDDDYD
ncbi:Glycine-rich domain-containing protein [Orpheovirus IHUMI-LCC2]|uniref:Glycine-rich domain-containing protein n=1 Tax=Orpheovirus IHUMI-LCC2 TaxID=2023057 RepID=A0A2I2L3W5_9VIRU|nr:Glycine-rich domain-containing protein [Orpheovirus IHUMI-LCC2]SNW62218.1 Glycine-rich domain-containing protein [Orpheovirus IHUMI-LCC2]